MNAFRIHRRLRSFLPMATLAASLFFSGAQQATSSDEVECDSIRLEMAGEGYDLTCEIDRSGNISVETLEANATDGTHFLVITDFRTNTGYIFESRGLREGIGKIFTSLEFEDWHGGKGAQGLITSEFTSKYKTVPSACVGFQLYTSRDHRGGWRRHVIGFGCSRVGDRSQVYEAMKHVDFPG